MCASEGYLNKEAALLFKTAELQQQYLLYCQFKTKLNA